MRDEFVASALIGGMAGALLAPAWLAAKWGVKAAKSDGRNPVSVGAKYSLNALVWTAVAVVLFLRFGLGFSW